jgi:hypothetical protein
MNKYTVEVKKQNDCTTWWEPLYVGNPLFASFEEALEFAESSAVGTASAIRIVCNGISIKVLA